MFDIANPDKLGPYVARLRRENPHSGILGRTNVRGLGRLILFSDVGARDTYAAHVKPFVDFGSFDTPEGEVVWGI